MLDDVQRRRAAIEARHPVWPEVSIAAYFSRCVDTFSNHPLVITDDRTLGYADIEALSARIAAILRADGVEAGDRISLLMPNAPILPAIMLAIWRLGAVVVPLNTSYRAEELAYALAQSESSMLVVGWAPQFPDLALTAEAALGDIDAAPWASYPTLRSVLFSGAGHRAVETLEARLERTHDGVGIAPVGAHDPALIMYTSGTTGPPKGVVLSHDNLLRAAFGEAHHKAFEEGRRALFSLPMYHAFGLVVGFLAGLPVGGAIIPLVKFDPAQMLDAIGRHQATFLMAVPTMTIAMLEAELKPHHDFSTLRSIHSSAASTPNWVWNAIYERFGRIDVFTSYGMTETTATIACTAPGDPLGVVASTVGRILEAGVAGIPERGGQIAEFRIVSPVTGQPLPVGEVGEICVRTPLAAQGYYGKPEETARLRDPEGWLRTGDSGRFREDGYLMLSGRLKDLYKTGGELVSPSEVEEVLTRHPAIAQAFVFGLPDDRWGEAGCAYIVPGETRPSPDEVKAHVKRLLAPFKVPKYVMYIDSEALPRTGTGKVQKFMLRDLAIADLRA